MSRESISILPAELRPGDRFRPTRGALTGMLVEVTHPPTSGRHGTYRIQVKVLQQIVVGADYNATLVVDRKTEARDV